MGRPKHLLHQTWTPISSLHDPELLGVFTSRPMSDDWRIRQQTQSPNRKFVPGMTILIKLLSFLYPTNVN